MAGGPGARFLATVVMLVVGSSSGLAAAQAGRSTGPGADGSGPSLAVVRSEPHSVGWLDPGPVPVPALVPAEAAMVAGHARAIFPPGSVGTGERCPRSVDDWSSVVARSEPEARQRAVDRAYCAAFGRRPDTAGRLYWMGQLADGLGRGRMVLELTRSDEYRLARGLVASDRTDPAGRAGGDPDPEIDPLVALRDLAPVSGLVAGSAIEELVDGRVVLTTTGFARWVEERGLDQTEPVTPAMVHGRVIGDGQAINVVYVHRSATRRPRVSPADRGPATVGSWAAEIGAHAAINGNWFGPWDGPAVSSGQVYGGPDHHYTALFGFTEDGDVLVEHHREINDGVDPRVVDGVSGHPTLIHRGQPTTDFGGDPTFTNRHPRTAIGLDRSGDVLILVTVDGRSSRAAGMTGDETARLLERLGAHEAVMLDGGGSTTMWIAGSGVVNRPSGAPRRVGNQVAVFGD